MTTPRCLVTVPVLGNVVPAAQSPIADVLQQRSHADLLVVDNGGDYRTVGDEEVIRHERNTGWTAASNLGFRLAFSRGYTHAVTLNSDTRLSTDFFAGLMDPRLPQDAGLIGPMYDDDGVARGWRSQASTYRGPAARYVPAQFFRSVPLVDGACLCITRAAWDRVGGLDERSFGRFAWGADVDLAIRAHDAGFGVYITETAYLNHVGRLTVHSIVSDRTYRTEAMRDYRRGMRQIYGRDRITQVKAAPYERRPLTEATEFNPLHIPVGIEDAG